jgi:micrococcal nuclease
MYFYKGKIEKVVDGDTLDIVIDLGFDIHYKCRVRLYGVNTPESRTKDLAEKEKGLATKKYVQDWAVSVSDVYIKTLKDATEKYGRILAVIYADSEMKVSLNDQLIDSGHAKAYFGGKRD